MEPIPEDRELPSSAGRTVASKSLLREVYTSEQVDTIVRYTHWWCLFVVAYFYT